MTDLGQSVLGVSVHTKAQDDSQGQSEFDPTDLKVQVLQTAKNRRSMLHWHKI